MRAVAYRDRRTFTGDAIILEITPEQAQTLLDVTRHIAGNENTRRAHTDGIRLALEAAGVAPKLADDIHPSQCVIEFI